MHDHKQRRHAAAKVLLVDNDDHFLSTLERLFKSGGFETCITWSGHEALRLLHDSGFDAMLFGDHLPDLHYSEFVRRARQQAADTYIVLMQNHKHTLRKTRNRHHKEVDAIVQKANPDQILETVAQRVSGH